ncbi:hypothetical protein KP003_14355 [Geomonas nitrogeniifigens]|uniref:hypothetical protein n=1 Tax=Geomonas diazotrophica TaxID=2843197 RepID=UPI001C2B7B9C|nr:hypothetical protein [Geomonas nitrogeniifigens]QXE85559.1 hypothetical protein KP003_14355 [Geomonas nitrogeniifigens]
MKVDFSSLMEQGFIADGAVGARHVYEMVTPNAARVLFYGMAAERAHQGRTCWHSIADMQQASIDCVNRYREFDVHVEPNWMFEEDEL